jgi:hypothetical protein
MVRRGQEAEAARVAAGGSPSGHEHFGIVCHTPMKRRYLDEATAKQEAERIPNRKTFNRRRNGDTLEALCPRRDWLTCKP